MSPKVQKKTKQANKKQTHRKQTNGKQTNGKRTSKTASAQRAPAKTEGSSVMDELLANSTVVVVVGPGGVGKTTMAAAMAARAASVHGRRCLVVTVDPARRLAEAMGIAELREEPVLVPLPSNTGGQSSGRLWALMVDMAQSWDRLIDRHAPDEETKEALLTNRLYQTLTRRFAQSHDYIALDHLVDLVEEDEYELIIIDTPPSVHAMDVLDAPDRMIEFFGSRLLRWLTAPYRSKLVMVTAKPFLTVAERLLGGEFLAEVTEFFWRFSSLQPDFVRRANVVKARMQDPSTHYVIVRTLEDGPAAQAQMLGAELEQRGHYASLWLSNRVVSNRTVDDAPLTKTVKVDPKLAQALAELEDQSLAQKQTRLEFPVDSAPEMEVTWRPGSVADIEALQSLLD